MIITKLAFFHAVGIRLSDMDLVYSLASVLEVVSSHAFNVSMFMVIACCCPFFISRSGASTSHDVISGVPLSCQCGLWHSVH